MSNVTNIIESGDLCTLSILVIVLVAVGQQFVVRDPELQRLGLRIAAGVGLVYAGIAITERGLSSEGAILGLVMRAIVVGGLVLGPIWIALSVGAYFLDRFRRMATALESRATAQRRERERIQREAEEQERRRLADIEWERSRPERERAEHEATERRRVAAEQAALDQKRRVDARATCEFEYALAAPEIAHRFPKPEFDAFVKHYLADEKSPEEVAERAEQLLGIIRQHLGKVEPPRPRSVGELAKWFEKHRADLEKVSDERTRRLMLIQLKVRYDELSSRLLEELSP